MTGNEDAAITFGTSLGWTLADADGSEYISAYEIGAFPANWGVAFNSNPNVTVTGRQRPLHALHRQLRPCGAAAQRADSFRVTPPANSDDDATVNVRARSTDADGSTAWSPTQPLSLTVRAVADAPAASALNASGNEDTWIPLTLSSAVSADADGSETLSIRITGVPTARASRPARTQAAASGPSRRRSSRA